MSTTVTAPPSHVDVLIIGAGISGIGAGAHLRRSAPQKSFAILEAREQIGGTWSLFKYPGIRSDSDLQTFGYQFKPWTAERVIAPGKDILAYLHETVADYDLADQIHFGYRVISADWSSADAHWSVRVQHGSEELELTSSYLFSATGYYNYAGGYTPEFPGLENFAGQVIHPQQWPEDLDYKNKRVVVIGSGATAMTLIPAMADDAARVTMLQRSPTYVVSLPSNDPIIRALKKVMPEERAFNIARGINIKRQAIFYELCQRYPKVMRKVLMRQVKAQLPADYPIEPNFSPRYNPWDERLCVVPNGDLFKAIRAGKADVVTDRISAFEADGIRLESGKLLEADIVVTATGLDLQAFGGAELRVDGQSVDPGQTVAYKSMMLSGIPNFAFSVGYTNASWTLKVDLVCEHFCRILNHMDQTGTQVVVPEIGDAQLERRPLLDFQAGYVQRRVNEFPKQATSEPWTVAMSYAADRKRLLDGPVTDPALKFSRAPVPVTA
ncbi:MAG: NAD(P)/FAD-dependent oxidoreductase [Solirubrobacterales bacterium]|nr:NAD(P)/FAD-dependent oxidoreductase [Solirubrobacterales bacterium]